METIYYCHRCKAPSEAQWETHGNSKRLKIRRFQTGFLAQFLKCGHCAPVGEKLWHGTKIESVVEEIRRGLALAAIPPRK